jgi:hypothetical protein
MPIFGSKPSLGDFYCIFLPIFRRGQVLLERLVSTYLDMVNHQLNRDLTTFFYYCFALSWSLLENNNKKIVREKRLPLYRGSFYPFEKIVENLGIKDLSL